MRTTFWMSAAAAALAATTAVLAQTTTKVPAYHVKQEVELKGKVASLKTIPDWMGKDGVNLAIEGRESTMVADHVDLATASFLEMLEFPLAVGDEVKLLGSWSTAPDGTQVFLVHEVTKKKISLNVRDPNGMPLW